MRDSVLTESLSDAFFQKHKSTWLYKICLLYFSSLTHMSDSTNDRRRVEFDVLFYQILKVGKRIFSFNQQYFTGKFLFWATTPPETKLPIWPLRRMIASSFKLSKLSCRRFIPSGEIYINIVLWHYAISGSYEGIWYCSFSCYQDDENHIKNNEFTMNNSFTQRLR